MKLVQNYLDICLAKNMGENMNALNMLRDVIGSPYRDSCIS